MDIIERAYDILNALTEDMTSKPDYDSWTRVIDEVCRRGNASEAILSLQSVLERNSYSKSKTRALVYKQLRMCLIHAPIRPERLVSLLKDVAASIVSSYRLNVYDCECFEEIVQFAYDFQDVAKGDQGDRIRTIIIGLLSDLAHAVLVTYVNDGSLGPVEPERPMKQSHRPLNCAAPDSDIGCALKLKEAASVFFPSIVEFARYANTEIERDKTTNIVSLTICYVIFHDEDDDLEIEGQEPIEWSSMFEICIPLIQHMYRNIDARVKAETHTLILIFIMSILSINDLIQIIFEAVSNDDDINIQRTGIEVFFTLYERLSLECRLEILKSAFCFKLIAKQFKAVCVDLVRDELHANFRSAPTYIEPEDDSPDAINIGRRRRFLKNIIDNFIFFPDTDDLSPEESMDGRAAVLCSPLVSTLSLIRYCASMALSGTPNSIAVKEFVNFTRVRNQYMNRVGDLCHSEVTRMRNARLLLDRAEEGSIAEDLDMDMLRSSVADTTRTDLICDMYNVTNRLVEDVINM